jgi:four helix bundle protein
VWQKTRELVKEIYSVTDSFPKSEIFGLTSQIRRAIVSVLLNIVEGQRRRSKKEFLHFLDTADASLTEVEACLEIAVDLMYLTNEQKDSLEIKRKEVAVMLLSLIKSIQKQL